MKKGQIVYMRKPDNLPTGGQVTKRESKSGLSKGTIYGIYPHHIVVQFEHYKSSYMLKDIRTGKEPYREVIK